MKKTENPFVGVETYLPKKIFENNINNAGALLTHIYLYRMCNRTYDIEFSIRDIAVFWGQKSRTKTTLLEKEIASFLNDYKNDIFMNADNLSFGELNDSGNIPNQSKTKKYSLRLNRKYFSPQSMHENKIVYRKINHAVLYKILNFEKYIEIDSLDNKSLVSVKILLHLYLLYRLKRTERLPEYSVEVKQEVYITYRQEISEALGISTKQIERALNLLSDLKIIVYRRKKRTNVHDTTNNKDIYLTNKLIITDYKIKNTINEFTGKYDTVSSDEEIRYSIKYNENKS